MSKIIQPIHEANDLPAKVSTYVIGLLLSVTITLLAYFAVVQEWWMGMVLVGIIVGLAVVQLLVQLVFFLHLGHEKGARWKLMTFSFAFIVVLIIVVGSLWIMHNLDYNMMHMTPEQQAEYMHDNEGI